MSVRINCKDAQHHKHIFVLALHNVSISSLVLPDAFLQYITFSIITKHTYP